MTAVPSRRLALGIVCLLGGCAHSPWFRHTCEGLRMGMPASTAFLRFDSENITCFDADWFAAPDKSSVAALDAMQKRSHARAAANKGDCRDPRLANERQLQFESGVAFVTEPDTCAVTLDDQDRIARIHYKRSDGSVGD
jgi:hypothetical protein